MDPPRLPRTVADLDEWSVYADHLMTIGDPLGDLIAFELSLPVLPHREQVAEFQDKARRRFRVREGTPSTWCLGHAHTLVVPVIGGKHQYPDQGALANATDFLRSPPAVRLEHLDVAVDARPHHVPYRRLFAALPATCRTVTVRFSISRNDVADTVLELLPPHVRELRVHSRNGDPDIVARFVLDRFDLVEPVASLADFRDLHPVLDATRSVRLRVDRAHGALHSREVLGTPDDAAIVDLRDRPGRHVVGTPPRLLAIDAPMVQVVAREELFAQQRRHGIVPVRTQLARTLAERTHLIIGHYEQVPQPAPLLELVRHADGWTARATPSLWVDDREIEDNGWAISRLPDGAGINVDGWPARFLACDIDARVRAMFAR